ncbi:hypothetical protein BCR44DRAFT_1458531 [Catenaria anguillulae PL171]|uniref:SET domain-containing protein n=1 Tax=Catenaria anguillulae PL171 TaxID=765915 RepID=A0A1Y2HZL0_9FUNG|nr:hypothetical protein BCR44DRAFT_1458531 [Catenaria anguillulae PL171]
MPRSWLQFVLLPTLAALALHHFGFVSVSFNLPGGLLQQQQVGSKPVVVAGQGATGVLASKGSKASRAKGTGQDKCLVWEGVPRLCPADERVWSESMVHPTLLTHPSPRRVLILGPLGPPLIAESLRHFTLTHVQWVSGVSASDNPKSAAVLDEYFDLHSHAHNHSHRLPGKFHYDDVTDELDRRRPNSGNDNKFDVILIDHLATPLTPTTLAAANAQLAPGGVLTVSLPASDATLPATLLPALAATFKHVHVGLEQVPSLSTSFLFALATHSDLHLSPLATAPTYVDTLIGRRVFDGDEDLDHYDGESHLRMYALPKQVRQRIQALVATSGDAKSKPTTYAPSVHAQAMSGESTLGVTYLREYFDCSKTAVWEEDDLIAAVRRGLELSHAQVLAMDDYSADDKEIKPLTEDEEAPMAVSLVVSATLADGHFTLRVYPNRRYASAEYTSYGADKATSPEEVLGLMYEELGAKRTIGSTVARGRFDPQPVTQAGGASVDYWYHGNDYWMSPKVLAKKSPTAGRGQFAGSDIKKGEVLFKGPIETYLRHEKEIKRMPEWRIKFVNHMGEQAEDDIWIAPPLYDEDASYFTNHNCDANLVYTGYDTMVARRDIAQGEELTFDYATADSEPRPIFKCNCGAKTCRGHVHGNDWQRNEVVDRYGVGAFWPHIQKKILRSRAGLPVASVVDPEYAKED